MKSEISYLFKLFLLGAIYFATAKFGLTFDPTSGFATLVWPPSGISLAALLLFGPYLFPAITVGAFLANFTQGAPVAAAVGISIGNTLEAVAAYFLLKKVVGFNTSLERTRDVFGLLILGAVVSTLIAAAVGTNSLYTSNVFSLSAYLPTLFAWWAGDMVSIIIITPLILVSFQRFKIRLDWRFLELTLLLTLTFVIAAFVFANPRLSGANSRPIAYLVFPVLIWAALRFQIKGAVVANFVNLAVATGGTLLGFGPFSKFTFVENLILLEIYMVISSLTVLVMGAVVTERKRVEERKDSFISIASHELKTPITTIKGYAELLHSLLLKKKSGITELAYISKLNEQVNRLIKLVDSLLDVSRIQTGKLELEMKRFSIDELIEEVVGEMREVSKKHQIIVEGRASKKIYADRDRIGEVLTNLISNAIKFSPRADRVIVRVESAKKFLTIAVIDFGIGISGESKERVFERFFQARTKIRKSFSGLGLGLYISQEIIKRHGGDVFIMSKKGEGSTFTIKLPYKK